MNLFDLIQGAATQTGLVPEQPVGRNPGLHPHGSRTRSELDPLQMILQNKQNTLQNIRSPMVRRSAGGRVVDENEPEGLDWLEANGPSRSGQPTHSWDQPKYSPFVGGGAEPQPQAQMTQSASGVRSMTGPYGGGFSTGVDAPLVGEFSPPSPYRPAGGQPYNPLDPTQEPMMADEQDALASNVQSAYNETMVNPRSSAAAGQAARSQALSRTTDAVRSGMMTPGRGLVGNETNVYGETDAASQPGSVTMPTVAPSNPTGVNSYTPFNDAPAIQASPLYDPAAAASDDVLASTRADAVGGDDPGFILRLLRQGGVNASRAADAVANTVRTKRDDPNAFQNSMTSWLLNR